MAFHSVFLVFLAGLAFFSEATPPDSDDSKHPLFIKILDSVRGSPAQNVLLKLYKEDADGAWQLLNSKQTDDNGESQELTTKEHFAAGIYKIELDTASYWKRLGLNPFHHYVDVVFTANDSGYRHYSIAVLLSPFSYSIAAVVGDPAK
ncbi:Transthyretin [Charadrius vociferus]|uniref:Transthyretin n=1 Tax=Charadrius vociferus TaxID=50402 RepID=A0A0A0AHZ1_CHAVO|nr:PREDICTED: transthyretin-like [Charadrius vociferus]KGL94099.1 Transthyretin [Charadrius vociferus]